VHLKCQDQLKELPIKLKVRATTEIIITFRWLWEFSSAPKGLILYNLTIICTIHSSKEKWCSAESGNQHHWQQFVQRTIPE
jgi:hypothetical protein